MLWRFGKVRLQRDRLLGIVPRPAAGLPLLPEDDAQVVVGLGEVGPQRDGLLEVCGSPVELALLAEKVAQVVVGFGIVGLEGHRLLEPRHGLVELALPPQDDAQVVVDLGDVGTQGENLEIGRGGLGQPPRTMFADGQRDESIQRGWLSGRRAGRCHQLLSLRVFGFQNQL